MNDYQLTTAEILRVYIIYLDFHDILDIRKGFILKECSKNNFPINLESQIIRIGIKRA